MLLTASPLAIDAGALGAFRSFVRKARPFVPRAPNSPDDFRQFVERATPIVVDRIHAMIDTHRARVEALTRTVVAHDLLEVAGFCGREVPYTELLRWLLAPETHLASALSRQRVLLAEIARRDPRIDPTALHFATAAWTNYPIPEYGILDLVLVTPEVAVIVETKTGTHEHETPAGTFQTVAYERGLRRSLKLAEHVPIAVVLLAPEIRIPVNPQAVPLTFAQLAGAFAEALPTFGLDDDTAWACRSALSHLITHAAPHNARHMRSGLAAARRYLRAQGDAERRTVVAQRIDVLVALVGALEDA